MQIKWQIDSKEIYYFGWKFTFLSVVKNMPVFPPQTDSTGMTEQNFQFS